MYRHLLIPTDGSARSEAAAVHAIGLAKELASTVTGLAVIVSVPSTRGDEAARHAQEWLASIAATADAAGVPCSTVTLRHERASEAIVHVAETMGCDLIVLASPKPDRAVGLLGGEFGRVLATSRIPVLVHRAPPGGTA
jgi:nucleotide-binding universal stress UspA family protein